MTNFVIKVSHFGKNNWAMWLSKCTPTKPFNSSDPSTIFSSCQTPFCPSEINWLNCQVSLIQVQIFCHNDTDAWMHCTVLSNLIISAIHLIFIWINFKYVPTSWSFSNGGEDRQMKKPKSSSNCFCFVFELFFFNLQSTVIACTSSYLWDGIHSNQIH